MGENDPHATITNGYLESSERLVANLWVGNSYSSKVSACRWIPWGTSSKSAICVGLTSVLGGGIGGVSISSSEALGEDEDPESSNSVCLRGIFEWCLFDLSSCDGVGTEIDG